MEYALEMKQINKSFSGVPVLKNVDFCVEKAKIHALCGENGAGKSTLMNILGGVIGCDSGDVSLFGEPVHITTPLMAQEHGIAFIHQELNVVNDLTVYENMFLGHELRTKSRLMDVSAMIEKTASVFEEMRVNIDPTAMMEDLQASYKQIVEIAKSILMDAKLIIMDEPTTSLTAMEIEEVFKLMKNLTQEHEVTIIFISHKLNEVVEFCDYVTVLRNGEVIDTKPVKSDSGELIEQEDIARMMIGRDVMDVVVYEDHNIGDVRFEVKDLTVDTRVKGVSLQVRAGEILGITGLLGDGRDELVRAIFGDLQKTGEILKDGEKIVYNHPVKAKKHGIGMLPSNRKENGVIPDMTVKENTSIVMLSECRKMFWVSAEKEDTLVEKYKKALSIKVEDVNHLILNLSGGNQQKVIVAKWLAAKPDLMILANPTQGVDVGAKNEIYKIIMELAKEGVAIIITSGEAPEIMKICDRAIVMYHGEIRGELRRDQLSEESIMILATGGSLEQ